jgi:CBS domain-containing protein
MKVKDILKTKGPEVVTIHDEKMVYEAMEVLVKHRIGSLLVLDQAGAIAGILTERDILNVSFTKYEVLKSTPVKDVMTSDLFIGEPEDELDAVENLMIENRIRHLPILDQQRLVGIISLGDVVKHQKKAGEFENRHLKDYIDSKYPG